MSFQETIISLRMMAMQSLLKEKVQVTDWDSASKAPAPWRATAPASARFCLTIFRTLSSANSLARAHADANLDRKGGSSSVVERQLPKLNVAGSIPVSRSNSLQK